MNRKNKNDDEKEENKEKKDNVELNEKNNNEISENHENENDEEEEEEEEDEKAILERKKKEEKKLDKMYKYKLETLKKKCCKDLKILNDKINKAEKFKKGYYELFLIESEIKLQLELIQRNLKNDGEKKLYKDMKKDYKNLCKELAEIRGEA